MTVNKRGLGRGLEALLTDVTDIAGIEQNSPASNDVDDQIITVKKQIDDLQTETHNILSEAEQVKNLLDELEDLIRSGFE